MAGRRVLPQKFRDDGLIETVPVVGVLAQFFQLGHGHFGVERDIGLVRIAESQDGLQSIQTFPVSGGGDIHLQQFFLGYLFFDLADDLLSYQFLQRDFPGNDGLPGFWQAHEQPV